MGERAGMTSDEALAIIEQGVPVAAYPIKVANRCDPLSARSSVPQLAFEMVA